MWLVSTAVILRMCGGYNHVNRQFQAETSQYENSNISETVNPIESKFEDLHLHFVGGLQLVVPLRNSIWLTTAI